MAESPYARIFTQGGEPRHLGGHPTPVQASKVLMAEIASAREAHPSEEGFADWMANYMERYAAQFAHPSFDASEGADSSGPRCSFCGMLWPHCGHGHLSFWVPVTAQDDDEVQRSDRLIKITEHLNKGGQP